MGLFDFLKSEQKSIPSHEKPLEGKFDASGNKISKYSQIIEELRILVNGRGHKDFFCLDSVYSPGSRMPAIDFSFWLKDKIKHGDKEALKILLWELVKGNPGLAISTEGAEEEVSNFFKGDWQANIDKIFEADISRYVMADPEVFDEIRVFMFFATIHNGLNGFIMTTSFPSLLSLVLIPWDVKFNNFENLIERANGFIRKMRKDTDYWKDVPFFKIDNFVNRTHEKEIESSFCKILGSLPFASRSHFFDVCGYAEYGKKTVRRPIAEMTFYPTRQLGIDAKESAQLLIKAGLVQEFKDSRLFLSRKTKDELSSILKDAGLPFKNSWKKEDFIEAVMQGCGESINTLAEDTYFGKVSLQFIEPARTALNYGNSMNDACELLLGFAA